MTMRLVARKWGSLEMYRNNEEKREARRNRYRRERIRQKGERGGWGEGDGRGSMSSTPFFHH